MDSLGVLNKMEMFLKETIPQMVGKTDFVWGSLGNQVLSNVAGIVMIWDKEILCKYILVECRL